MNAAWSKQPTQAWHNRTNNLHEITVRHRYTHAWRHVVFLTRETQEETSSKSNTAIWHSSRNAQLFDWNDYLIFFSYMHSESWNGRRRASVNFGQWHLYLRTSEYRSYKSLMIGLNLRSCVRLVRWCLPWPRWSWFLLGNADDGTSRLHLQSSNRPLYAIQPRWSYLCMPSSSQHRRTLLTKSVTELEPLDTLAVMPYISSLKLTPSMKSQPLFEAQIKARKSQQNIPKWS